MARDIEQDAHEFAAPAAAPIRRRQLWTLYVYIDADRHTQCLTFTYKPRKADALMAIDIETTHLSSQKDRNEAALVRELIMLCKDDEKWDEVVKVAGTKIGHFSCHQGTATYDNEPVFGPYPRPSGPPISPIRISSDNANSDF